MKRWLSQAFEVAMVIIGFLWCVAWLAVALVAPFQLLLWLFQ
jgi:hypothetical protein